MQSLRDMSYNSVNLYSAETAATALQGKIEKYSSMLSSFKTCRETRNAGDMIVYLLAKFKFLINFTLRLCFLSTPRRGFKREFHEEKLHPRLFKCGTLSGRVRHFSDRKNRSLVPDININNAESTILTNRVRGGRV